MKGKQTPAPLQLCGKVYVQGVLAESFGSRSCPRKPEAGALRIHSHLDEEGLKQRQRAYCAAGYSGYIRASVFDGKSWRKFMLAREASPAERQFKNFQVRVQLAAALIKKLACLSGKTCVYRDGAFAVLHEEKTQEPAFQKGLLD